MNWTGGKRSRYIDSKNDISNFKIKQKSFFAMKKKQRVLFENMESGSSENDSRIEQEIVFKQCFGDHATFQPNFIRSVNENKISLPNEPLFDECSLTNSDENSKLAEQISILTSYSIDSSSSSFSRRIPECRISFIQERLHILENRTFQNELSIENLNKNLQSMLQLLKKIAVDPNSC